MARLNPMIKRSVGTKNQYLGKIIIFCEGKTEENYFNHYARILNNKSIYSHIEIQLVNVSGNAQTVYNKAEEVLNENLRKYSLYEKYLVFDCDDPENIQDVIQNMKNSTHEYKLLVTNLTFEVWLIMHFEYIDSSLTKNRAYEKMANYLNIPKYKSREKANEGTIRKVIDNGDNVKRAIENAKKLEQKYKKLNYNIYENIKNMNSYTNVYKLVEKILLEV